MDVLEKVDQKSHKKLQGSESLKADWRQFYSDSSKYELQDLFNEEAVHRIEQLLQGTKFVQAIEISISVVAIIAFVVSGFLLVTGATAPVYDGSTDSIVGMLLYLASKWFGISQNLTGSGFTFSTILSLVVGLLSESHLSWGLSRETQEYKQIIEEVREEIQQSKQIYPGSGTLQFSYGAAGLLVSGGNIEVKVNWDAVWFLVLIEKREIQRRRKPSVQFKRLQDFTFGDDEIPLDPQAVDRTTHLLIYMQPTLGLELKKENIDASEFLVVPRRFFENRRDASVWSDFVTNLMPYKRRFEERQRAAIRGSTSAASGAKEAGELMIAHPR